MEFYRENKHLRSEVDALKLELEKIRRSSVEHNFNVKSSPREYVYTVEPNKYERNDPYRHTFQFSRYPDPNEGLHYDYTRSKYNYEYVTPNRNDSGRNFNDLGSKSHQTCKLQTTNFSIKYS